jgi:hypothetical protein
VARKSLVQRSEVDEVQKSHNCQANRKHRLIPGDRRLRVHVGRSHDHYCSDCAKAIIAADIAKLQELARQLLSPT